MYNKSQISAEFANLIGVRPSKDYGNDKIRIDKSLNKSLSGQFLDGINGLFKIENLATCADDFTSFEPEDYNPLEYYPAGYVVQDDDYQVHECLIDNTGEPLSNPLYWRKTTLLSVWIREQYDAAVYETIDALIERKRAGGYGKLLKDSTALYNGEGVKSNAIKKSGRFVGYKIRLRQPDMNMQIQRMGMQLTGVANIPIYLYHSVATAHIHTWNYTNPSINKFSYSNVPDNIDLNNPEGYYVIGYYESDLPAGVEAIKLISNTFADSSCGSCGGSGGSWKSFIEVTPMSVAGANAADGMVWSMEDAIIDDSTNWGLNFSMTFRCDMSDLFIRNKMSFVPALAARLNVKFLSQLRGTTRDNTMGDQIQVLANSDLRSEFEDNPYHVFNRSIKALDFEFSGINQMCLPIEIYGQISYGTV